MHIVGLVSLLALVLNVGTLVGATAPVGEAGGHALPLQVVDASIDVHVIGLAGFAARRSLDRTPPSAKGKQQPQAPKSKLTVDQTEKVTGYVKVAEVTVQFNQPVHVERGVPSAVGLIANRTTRFPVWDPSRRDKFGLLGTTRLVCGGGRIFESHPSLTHSNSPPRFMVPADMLALFVPDLPAVAASVPFLRSCPGPSQATRALGGFPADNQVAFLLLMAHSRAGERGSIYVDDTDLLPAPGSAAAGVAADLSSCKLQFLDPSSQSWRPTASLTPEPSAAAAPFTGSVPLRLGTGLRFRAAGERLEGSPAPAPLASGAQAVLANVPSSAFPLPPSVDEALASAAASSASPAQAQTQTQQLCWSGSPAKFRSPSVAGGRSFMDLVFEAADTTAEAASPTYVIEPSFLATATAQTEGIPLGSKKNKTTAPRLQPEQVLTVEYAGESARKHGRGMVALPMKDRSVYDIIADQERAMGASAPSAPFSAPGEEPAAAFLEESTHVSAADDPLSVLDRKPAQPRGPSFARSASSALVSSLVLHAEPWSLSLLELSSSATAGAGASVLHRTGTGGIMGILHGGLAPVVAPMIDLISGGIAHDLANALADALADHTTMGVSTHVIDILEPLLTGEVISEIVPALTETITDEVIDEVSRTVADNVAQGTTAPVTTEVSKRLAFSLLPRLVNDIVPRVSTGIVTNMTRALTLMLPRSLAHSIVPALAMTLTISPNDHNFCYKCLVDGGSGDKDSEACKKCPPSMRTESIWGMPPHLYYSLYYTGYYATYYSAYYSDIFTASPGIKMVRRKQLEVNDVLRDPFYYKPVYETENS